MMLNLALERSLQLLGATEKVNAQLRESSTWKSHSYWTQFRKMVCLMLNYLDISLIHLLAAVSYHHVVAQLLGLLFHYIKRWLLRNLQLSCSCFRTLKHFMVCLGYNHLKIYPKSTGLRFPLRNKINKQKPQGIC